MSDGPAEFKIEVKMTRAQAIAYMRQIAELYGYEVKKKQ